MNFALWTLTFIKIVFNKMILVSTKKIKCVSGKKYNYRYLLKNKKYKKCRQNNKKCRQKYKKC